MDKQGAREIIGKTFENSFDKEQFIDFIKSLLNKIEGKPLTYRNNYIPGIYKKHIKTLERIGEFNDADSRIDILVITLQGGTSLEGSPAIQRNFIAWYLTGGRDGKMKDAALAAYVSPDEAGLAFFPWSRWTIG